MALPPETSEEPKRENEFVRYWQAQPGSAVFLIVATVGCAIALPLSGYAPEGFGLVRQVLAGALIGLGFGMLPVAHRIWD